MNNEQEFAFLNDTQKTKKQHNLKGFWNIIYWILQVLLYIIYIVICVFCSIIELFFVADFGISAVKTSYNKKRKRKKLFF